MKTWTSVLALLVATVMIAASAFAQAPAPKDKPEDKAGSASSPSAPSTSAPSSSKDMPASSSADKSKDTKSKDAAKPDTMKSDMDKQARGKGERMGGGGNREQVRSAQQALKDKGHDPGSVDGVMGPKTQAALKDFQKAQGLKETGRLDAETMAKLGIESKTSRMDTSTPAASPKTGAARPDSSGAASGSSTASPAPSATGGTAPSDAAKDMQKRDTPKQSGNTK